MKSTIMLAAIAALTGTPVASHDFDHHNHQGIGPFFAGCPNGHAEDKNGECKPFYMRLKRADTGKWESHEITGAYHVPEGKDGFLEEFGHGDSGTANGVVGKANEPRSEPFEKNAGNGWFGKKPNHDDFEKDKVHGDLGKDRRSEPFGKYAGPGFGKQGNPDGFVKEGHNDFSKEHAEQH